MKKYTSFLILFMFSLITSAELYAQKETENARWSLSNQAVTLSKQHLTSKTSIDSLNALTFEGWFKMNPQTQDATLFAIGNKIQLTYANKKLNLMAGNDHIKTVFKNDEEWHHFAVMIHSQKRYFSIAIDGKMMVSQTLKEPLSIRGKIIIGNNFCGQIDEIRIWSDALPPEQLWFTTVLSVSHPHYKNLLAYWRFDKHANDCKFSEFTHEKTRFPLSGKVTYENVSNGVCYGMTTGYLREAHLVSNQVSRAMFLCVNDLIYFSDLVGIKENGECFIKEEKTFKKNIEKLREILKGVDGIQIRLGFHGGLFRKWMSSPETRERFAKTATHLVQKYGFDGLDFDFEWLLQWKENEMWAAYAQTTNAVRRYAPRSIFSVSFGSWSCNLPTNGRDAVDYYTFQNYGPLSFRFTFEHFKKDANVYKTFGFPRERSLLGHPFYGTCNKGGHYTRHYKQILDRSENLPLNADKVDLPFGKKTLTIYFNGVETIRQKTKWAREEKCLGIMTWDIAGDVEPTSPFSLMRAVNEFYGSLATPKK